jgi:hypothetical protein
MLAAVPAAGYAQGGRVVPPPVRRPAARALKEQRQADRADSGDANADRAALRRQVQQAFARTVRRQLNLNDDQMQTLMRVNQKYDRQRNEIVRDERQARLGLRSAMLDTASADQNARIDQQMGLLVQAQRRRADMLESEQKELSGFLTPLQRARFSVLQDNLAANIRKLQQGNAAAVGPPGPPPDPQPQH